MFFKRKPQENKILDDLEMDKDARFKFMLSHPGASLEDYWKYIYKDNPKKLKELFGEKNRK